MSYIFSFTRFAGWDKVFLLDQKIEAKPWDLLLSNDEYFIYLGEEISFPDLYKISWDALIKDFHIEFKNLLSVASISMIHHMVSDFLTSYRNVIPLRIGSDIFRLVKKFTKSKPVNSYQKIIYNTQNNQINISNQKWKGQQLIVFPDLRTINNSLPKSIYNDENIAILTSSSTITQKMRTYRWIKQWSISTLICTYSQIFQDRKNLDYILMTHSHKWYYKSQQDPRFSTKTVLEKMSKIYGADLVLHGLYDFQDISS